MGDIKVEAGEVRDDEPKWCGCYTLYIDGKIRKRVCSIHKLYKYLKPTKEEGK